MSSQVKKTHPKYDEMAPKWQRVRDVVSGTDASKKYLIVPKGLTEEDDKNAYKNRPVLFNATWKTVQALSGMVFRKPPVTDVAESIKPYLEDVTMSGVKFDDFAKEYIDELIEINRAGIIVDYPAQSAEGMTAAEAEKLNLRPTMQLYKAESIDNWRTQWVGNKTVLMMVKLAEDAALESNGEFDHKTEKRWRVLDLAKRKVEEGAGETEGLVYRVRVFRVNEKEDKDEQVGATIYPKMNGKPLDFIPFFFEPKVDEPPLIDLVDTNIAHFRVSADYEHGCHFTGLAQAVVHGYQPPDGEKLYYGGANAWCFADPQAGAEIMAMDNDFVALTGNLERKERQMAILGLRMLLNEKKDTETAQTANIHRAGESSTLSDIGRYGSNILTKALRVFAEWAGSPGEWSVALNDEFLPPEVTPQELAEWLKAWQAGAPGFSDQGLFSLFQKRELVAADVTLEDEQQRIGEKRPVAPGEDEAA